MPPLHRLRNAVANLRSPLDLTDERAGVLPQDCTYLANQLETLAIISVLGVSAGRLPAETLTATADALVQHVEPINPPDSELSDSPDVVQFAHWVAHRRTEFLAQYAMLTGGGAR